MLSHQRVKRRAPFLGEIERDGGSRAISPLITVAVTIVPAMPARSQSVPLATQNSRTRSGTLSAAA